MPSVKKIAIAAAIAVVILLGIGMRRVARVMRAARRVRSDIFKVLRNGAAFLANPGSFAMTPAVPAVAAIVSALTENKEYFEECNLRQTRSMANILARGSADYLKSAEALASIAKNGGTGPEVAALEEFAASIVYLTQSVSALTALRSCWPLRERFVGSEDWGGRDNFEPSGQDMVSGRRLLTPVAPPPRQQSVCPYSTGL